MNETIMPYPGGKKRLSKIIFEIMPSHKRYVEVFAGSSYIYFYKKPAEENIVNDIDKNLYIFYKVLQNTEKFNKLFRKLYYTPYSRNEFIEACKIEEKDYIPEDEVEIARKFFVLIWQSYSGKRKVGGFYHGNLKRNYFRNINNLQYFHNKIQNAVIENLDFAECIKRFDSPETFFFLDPPYILETMSKDNHYKHILDTDRHIELVEILKTIKGKAILCGYDNNIYNELKWNVIKIDSPVFIKNGKYQKERIIKTECLYYNYDLGGDLYEKEN